MSMDGPEREREREFKKPDLSAAGTESLILINNAIMLLQIYLFFAHRAVKNHIYCTFKPWTMKMIL